MVTDVHGNWSLKALETFLELTRDIAARRGSNGGAQLRFLKKRLACAIMRGNARALTLSLDPLEPDLESDAMDSESPRESVGGPASDEEPAKSDGDNEDGPAFHQLMAGASSCVVCGTS